MQKIFIWLCGTGLLAGHLSYTDKFIMPMISGQRDRLIGPHQVPPKLNSLCDLAYGILTSDKSVKREDILKALLSNPRINKKNLAALVEIKHRRAQKHFFSFSSKMKKIDEISEWVLEQITNNS